MKRLIALILALTTMIGMISCLSGCGSEDKNITKGELLNMLCDSFGMYNYSSKEPHTETVKEGDKYFAAVQSAYEWEIINDKKIDTGAKVSKDFLSSVLVKSVGVVDTANMSKDEITKYAHDNKYVTFSYRGRTDGKRLVTYNEAVESLKNSAKLWSERKFSTPVEQVKYGENTHELTKHSASVTNNADGTISVPSNLVGDIKAGDTYVAKDPKTNAAKLYKVESVETVGNEVVITPSDEQPALETAIQDLDASGTIAPDLTECMITDGLGNPISSTSVETQSNSTADSAQVTPLVQKPGAVPSENLAKASFALNFEIDGVKIRGTVSSEKISFSAKGDLYTNKSKTVKISVDKSYDIKNINLDYNYKFEWFNLKYAYAKLDYTTVDTTKVGIKFEKTSDDYPLFSKAVKDKDKQKAINDAVHQKLSNLQGKAGKSIKICEVPVYTNGVVSFDIVVRLKISISGEVELVVTTENAKGVEYKNGNIRWIKEEKKDTDLKVSAKAELTIYIGAAFKAVGVNVVGFGIEGGVGASGSVIIHIFDQERRLLTEVSTQCELTVAKEGVSFLVGGSLEVDGEETLTLDTEVCFDYKVYGILKFTIDTESVIGKIFDGLEIEIYGEDNATIKALSGHIEDGKKVEKCTREYRSGDEEDDKNSEEGKTESNGGNDTQNNQSGSNGTEPSQNADHIDIDTYFINLSVGGSYNLKVDAIPSGYTISDIVFESSDNSVARVDSNGKITGVASGNTTVKVKTKDGKYSQECVVMVVSEGLSNQNDTVPNVNFA